MVCGAARNANSKHEFNAAAPAIHSFYGQPRGGSASRIIRYVCRWKFHAPQQDGWRRETWGALITSRVE